MKSLKKLMAALSIAALAGFLPACGSEPSKETVTSEDTVVGTGATVVSGDTVTVDYVGTFTNGTQFDANANYPVRIGVGAVIKGWDQGIPGMRVGGVRKLTVPPSLAYGKDGNSAIPGNSTLIFVITLKAIAGK